MMMALMMIWLQDNNNVNYDHYIINDNDDDYGYNFDLYNNINNDNNGDEGHNEDHDDFDVSDDDAYNSTIGSYLIIMVPQWP